VAFCGTEAEGNFVTIEYTLFKSIVALSSDRGVTHIPAGAVVEAPAMFGGTGIVKVIYQGHVLRMLALDLQDGGEIYSGDKD
jgi:hypothetical protein